MRQGIRRGVAAVAVAAAVLTATATETTAKIIDREDYEFTDSGDAEVCGLPIDYDFADSGRLQIRQGRPGTPTEFWSVQGSSREVITNPVNDKFIVITSRYHQRDVRATLVEDETYRFRFQIAANRSSSATATARLCTARADSGSSTSTSTIPDGRVSASSAPNSWRSGATPASSTTCARVSSS